MTVAATARRRQDGGLAAPQGAGRGAVAVVGGDGAAARAVRAVAGDTQADVVVVGGGYTGLAAAHALAAAGSAPLVLEAETIGWGASGRNGGVVSGKFRLAYTEMARRHGLDVARRMNRLAHEAMDQVAALVEEFGISAARFERNGSIRCAHNERMLAAIVDEARWLERELGDPGLVVLDRDQVHEETGSTGFTGGVLTRDAGHIHPLGYVRGLAAGLGARGVVIHERSPALGLRRDGDGLVVETPGGTVRCRQAILATNAYSGLTPASDAIRRSLIPFRSAIIATAPLPHNVAGSLMANRRSYGETRRMMRWFRKVDDRVVFGGRGAFGKNDSASAFDGLERAMLSLFPEVEGVPVDFRWSGHVGMTLDALPHVGRLDDRVSFAAGYNGAGVAMSSLLGRYAARAALGESLDVGLLDARHLRRVPFYPLREAGVRLVAGWYQFLDRIGR